MAQTGAYIFTLFSFLLITVGALPQSGNTIGGMTTGEILNALSVDLVEAINVTISLDSFTTNTVSVTFVVNNPLVLELTLSSVSSDAGLNGTVSASFSHTFSQPLVVPPLSTKSSGTIDNVLLTQGINEALNLVPFGVLDLSNTNVQTRVGTILGFGGIPLPIDGLKQSNIPTTYILNLD